MKCEICGELTFDYDGECKSCAVKRARRDVLKKVNLIWDTYFVTFRGLPVTNMDNIWFKEKLKGLNSK